MRKITFLFLSLFIAASAMAIENVTSGYYHLIGRDTNRSEHLYNNALHSGNSMKFTLQSNEMVNTNNGIWYITVNENGKLGIKNGDGQPVVAGANWGGDIAGSFTELTVAGTADVNDYRYYYFNEALNCTNGSANFKIGGADFLTTWSDGGSANDNQWRFEPVDVEGKSIYNIVVEGNADAYVTYGDNYAFNGGFFIADSEISASQLTVGIFGNVLKSADVDIEGNTITVTNVQALETPVKQDLYNTSKGDGIIPPYRIPGITTASNGRLITAAARLVCGTDPGYGQVDVVCRTSDDHGKTWSDMIDVAVGTGRTSATVNYFDTAFGDPAIVADRTSGEVLIIAVAGCTVYANGNTTRQNPNMIATILSKDNGKTWEEPINVTEDIYSLFDSGNPIQSAFVGGGKVFQSRIVKKDKYYRLYAAMCARPNGNRVIYSDDFGKTWHALGGASALPAPGGDEPKCEEMPDGRVILSSRVGGGRIYNIYTYSNTLEGTGEWSTSVKSTFEGSGLTPGGNSTNGEILIVPVQRNSDGKEMYLALQSLPTGGGRTNVGIFYKELTDVTDLNTVANFATDWNGFYQVSNTSSAYSSMDLQADGRIGFIYEETLTGFGRRDNPVSTSFPNGEGQHNFDGFDNIYVAYELEYITNGAYSIKRDVDRRAFVREYFTSVAAEKSDEIKSRVASALSALSAEPTTAEIDNIYAILASDGPVYVTDVDGFENGKIYTFVTARGWMGAKADNNKVISTAYTANGVTGSKDDANFQWTVYKSENDNYYLYNIGKEMFMGVESGNNTAVPFVATPAGKNLTFKKSADTAYPIMFSTDNAGVVNHSANHASGLITWTGGWTNLNDGGSNHQVELVGVLDNETLAGIAEIVAAYELDNTSAVAELDAAISKAQTLFNSISVGSGVGEYTATDAEYADKFSAIVAFRQAIQSTNTPTPAQVEAKTAEVNALIASFRLNLPVAGKYYRILAVDGWNDDARYLGAQNSTANTSRAGFVAEADANTIFYFDGTQLVSYASGNYLVSNSNMLGYNGIQAAGSVISFQAAAKGLVGAYNIKFNSGSRYLYCNKSNYTDAGSSTNNDNGYCFNIEEVTVLPVTITDAGYATFFAPVAVTVPAGVTAYTATVDGEVAKLNEIGATIPANTGVVLAGQGDYNLAITTAAAFEGENALRGTVAATNVTENAYVLANDAEGVGFYAAAMTNGAWLNNSHKAYLPKAQGMNAASYSFRFGEGTTAIGNVEVENTVKTIYDLTGRRVEVITAPGIYIVDGKKVLVK